MMKVLKKMDVVLELVLRWFVIAMFIGIGVLLFGRVIIRVARIHIPMSWSDEIVEWMMAWMIFTGATLLVRYGDHFRVDLLQEKFKGRPWVNVLNVLITILSIAFYATLLYYSILLVKGANWFSPILKVSTRVPYLSMPVNCVLILFYLIRDLVVEMNGFKKLRPQAPPDVKREAA
ncbi:MAG: TRAP transporter small permease [Ruminiclostridium sp.]|nr:TRAP transporter small permease [Ruminiclostridium sp.]